jgi:muramoyltetrapeptide carboxypeptidase
MPGVFNSEDVKNRKSFDQLFDLITGASFSYHRNTHPEDRQGEGRGSIVGGNLSILSANLGTPTDVSFDHQILFIEEVGEPLYVIDRLLGHLKRSGKFDKITGLIVGKFTEIRPGAFPFGESLTEVIHRNFSHLNIPVMMSYPAGHEDENRPVLFGQPVKLSVTNEHAEIIEIK